MENASGEGLSCESKELAQGGMMLYAITISKTSDGKQEYLQIMSKDGFAVNLVLIGKFELRDARKD